MTVSRALSGHPNVTEKKRTAIIARAAELGYVKSSAANAMRGEPTAIVGLLLPNIVNEFYARFANTLGLLCADQGLDLVIHLTNDDGLRERQSLRRLQALQANTVIMVPTPANTDGHLIATDGLRVINLIRTPVSRTVGNTLLIDDEPSIAAAVSHLMEGGIRHIGYIGGTDTLSSGRGRLGAFRNAMLENGVTPSQQLIRTGAPGYDMGAANALDLLNSTQPMEALICGGFEISNGALDQCLHHNIKFPDDLAFIGYGDPSSYQWIAGGITTIALSADDIAKRAAQMLTNKPAPAPAEVALSPTTLVIRNSA